MLTSSFSSHCRTLALGSLLYAALAAQAINVTEDSTPGFSAQAEATSSTVGGSSSGWFISRSGSASARADVGFTAYSMAAEFTPVTFHFELTGQLLAEVDNANVGLSAGYGFGSTSSLGLIHQVGWSVGWVDGPSFMGDFAGIDKASPGIGAAGYPLSSQWTPAEFDGRGSVSFTTDLPLRDGDTGSFWHQVDMGLGGNVESTLSFRLTHLSTSAMLAPGAHLLLDNGQRIEITSAVPEPKAWLLLLGGLVVALLSQRPKVTKGRRWVMAP